MGLDVLVNHFVTKGTFATFAIWGALYALQSYAENEELSALE
jgi:hypothetical protein